MKTFYTHFLSTTLIIIAVNLSSCGDNCNVDCDSIKEAPQEFLDYWYFPEGSWWVYKRRDTTADVFDTATVVNPQREIYCNCKIRGDTCVESLSIMIEHSSDELKATGGRFMINTEIYYNICRSSGNLISGSAGTPHVSYPFVIGKIPGYTVALTDTANITFEKYDFKKYIVYDYLNPRIEENINRRHVFVKDIGMVYMYHRDYSEWELWDYHVIQN